MGSYRPVSPNSLRVQKDGQGLSDDETSVMPHFHVSTDQVEMGLAFAAFQQSVQDVFTLTRLTEGAYQLDLSGWNLGTMMAGGRDVQPVDFHELKDMLPASLPGLPRVEATAQSGEAMSLKTASALARYSDGKGASVTIELQDLGSLSGIAAMASKFDPKIEKETLTGYERTRQVSGHLVHERYDRQQKDGETSVLVGGRFSVSVRGQGVDASQLTGALQAVDLARLPKLVAAK